MESDRRPVALVVEDDALLAQLFASMLEAEGLTTVLSLSGHDAVRLAEQYPPQLVVMDLMLPGIHGTSITVALRARWRGLPIIIVSALAENVVAEEARQSGAFAYLTKPFEMDDLLAVVRRALLHSAMASPKADSAAAESPSRAAAESAA